MPADIHIEAKAKVIQKKFQRLQKRNQDMREVFADIAPKMVTTTQLRFKQQQNPTGRFWKKSKAARKENRKTLIRTGNLMRSIEATYDKREIQVGTDVKYGHFFQVGGTVKLKGDYRLRRRRGSKRKPPVTRRIVQRKFLGIGKRDRKTINKLLTRRIKESLGVR